MYGPDKLGVEIFASETRDSMRTVLESENHGNVYIILLIDKIGLVDLVVFVCSLMVVH